MSSFKSAFGAHGYDHGAQKKYSQGNPLASWPLGQNGNSTAGVPVPGHSYPFGYAPAGATSMPPFRYSYPFGYNNSLGGISIPPYKYSYPFWLNSGNDETSVPAFPHNSHAFGFTPVNGGTSLPAFGQNTANTFGFTPNNGGILPAFAQNSSTPFGSALASGGASMPAFGQNSPTPFGSPLAAGGTSMPAFSTPFGGAPANGGTSVPAFSTPFGGAPANGGTSVPAFRPSINSFGFTPSNTITSVPAWQHSNPPGPVNTGGGTPANTFEEGRSYFPPAPTNGASFVSAPTNGATSVPACGPPLSSIVTQAAPASPIYSSLSGLPSGTSSLIGTDPSLFGTQNQLSGSTTHFQTPTINASSSPGFGFGCTTSGQTTTQFGTIGNLNETSSCSDEVQSPFSGCQVKAPSSGESSSRPLNFRISRGGSRMTPYTETVELEPGSQQSTRFMSISAMPVFRDKCHEELRWEDKQFEDNGRLVIEPVDVSGNVPLFHSVRSGQSAIGSQFIGSKVKPYSKTLVGVDGSRAASISAMPVCLNKSHEELRWEDHHFNNAGGGVDPDLAQLNCFRNPVSRTGSSFQNAMPSSVPPNISASSPPCFTFPTCSTPITSNLYLNNLRGGAYTSITQPLTFAHPNLPIISASASEASRSGPSFLHHTSAPCTSICSTVTTPVAASVPCNFPPSISTLDVVSPSRCRAETPPAVPHMSAEGPKTTSVRYGIFSTPVNHSENEKQKLVLPPECNWTGDGPKVAFSADAHETPTARMKLPLLPKDNSGILISGPSEEWALKIDFENMSHIKHTSIHVYENGKVSVELSKPLADGFMYQDKVGNPGETFAAENSLRTNSVNGNYPSEKEDSSNAYGLMPKLKDSDYFIEPRVEELAIKESFEPGFCSHVKDFVVGHQLYGRIKFLGETDVRQLDVNSHIVFRNREVIFSMDENKKPPVGHGLNKPAEITLCNIICVDKAGNRHINGPKVEKYKKKLMKKAAEQGAEFMSYDPVQGEWKFRVEHF